MYTDEEFSQTQRTLAAVRAEWEAPLRARIIALEQELARARDVKRRVIDTLNETRLFVPQGQ